MLESKQRAELAGALATVALASLGGPLSATGAALGQGVKLARAKYETGGPARDLERAVAAGVEQWAQGEQFAPDEVALGLVTAAEAVRACGASTQEMADQRFDPDRISSTVIARARARDPHWDPLLERHYAAAEQAVRITYALLAPSARDQPDGLSAAVTSARTETERFASRVTGTLDDTRDRVDALADALLAPAVTDDVIAYLEARVRDWDHAGWLSDDHVPSLLERPLRVVERAGPGGATSWRASTSADLFADDARAGQRMLVVLGGPGSGKSWLSRRYAREAARDALERLRGGAELGEVELPLLTTWAQWVKQPGDTRHSLFESAFSAGFGLTDMPAGSLERLRRTFTDDTQPVLLVIDSLDEAADVELQSERLNGLMRLSSWRVITTSRPAAWTATYRGTRGSGGPRVVELDELRYPEDVEAFIAEWFAADLARGQAVRDEILERDDLTRTSVIPLMLTFYCLLAEESGDPDRRLPSKRRALFSRLVRRLLLAAWRSGAAGPDVGPDLADCEQLLTDWAWSAVATSTTPAGLGNWGDTFLQPTQARPDMRSAINHVVPKVSLSADGVVERRFVHRTVLEHLVAEHVAALPAAEAAQALLPHLWFDVDWQLVVPAALAAHNQREPGQLLDQLDELAYPDATRGARAAASAEMDAHLLLAAAESQPAEWRPDQRQRIHDCRVRHAAANPLLVRASSHWAESNEAARDAVLEALLVVGGADVAEFANAFTALAGTEREREIARAALLVAIGSPDPPLEPAALAVLAAAMSTLGAIESEREQARALLLHVLPHAYESDAGHILDALVELAPDEPERLHLHEHLLATIPGAGPMVLPLVVRAVTHLPGAGEGRAALQAALKILPPGSTELDWSVRLVALATLAGTDGERAEVRGSMLDALPQFHHWSRSQVLQALPTVAGAASGEVRDTLLLALRDFPSGDVPELVDAILNLPDPASGQQRAREALLERLEGASEDMALVVLSAFARLDLNEVARATVLDRALSLIPNAGPYHAEALAALVAELASTEQERSQARDVLLGVIASIDSMAAADVARHLGELAATPEDVDRVRGALAPALAVADRHSADAVIDTVMGLPSFGDGRVDAKDWLMAALPGPDHEVTAALVDAIVELEPTLEERHACCSAVLDALPTAASGALADLLMLLPSVQTTEAERHAARAALTGRLSDALFDVDEWPSAEELLLTLPTLATSAVERDEIRSAILDALPKAAEESLQYAAFALRALSPVDIWLAWLAADD